MYKQRVLLYNLIVGVSQEAESEHEARVIQDSQIRAGPPRNESDVGWGGERRR
jgi:hypothetical protein